MNTQFKKGVLEMLVLHAIETSDKYGYELVNEVGEAVDVNEGTIYPILKRLNIDFHLETYLQESNEGPPRKYYHITLKGQKYLTELCDDWKEFSKGVNNYLGKGRKTG